MPYAIWCRSACHSLKPSRWPRRDPPSISVMRIWGASPPRRAPRWCSSMRGCGWRQFGSTAKASMSQLEHEIAHFEERFGEGATELDALEALHPGMFARIVSDEIKRYWNPDHDAEVVEQVDRLNTDLAEIEEKVHQAHSTEIEAFKAELAEMNRQVAFINTRVADCQARIKPVWQ